jgi:uncharacterized delta-60 repeat protein
MKRSLTLLFVLVSFLFSIGLSRSAAAPGDLDLSFGGFGSGGKIEDLGFSARAMAIDAQGRLVLVGSLHNTFHVQRRSGSRFRVTEDVDIIIDSGQTSAAASAVAIAPDGKIVVAGTLTLQDHPSDFAVARLNPDLTLDTTFAGDGATSSDFDQGDDGANAVAVQGDGKIVLAGYDYTGVFGINRDFAVERFKSDGTLDPSFNGNGKWTKNVQPIVAPFATANELNAMVIQPDGKIVVGGFGEVGTFAANDQDFIIMRLNADGSTDDAFGDDGLVATDFGGHESVFQLALAPDATIVAVGGDDFGFLGENHPVVDVARYATDGTLLKKFARPADGTFNPCGVIVQPDGKVIVGGAKLLRYLADGSLDAPFGADGEVGGGACALALQPDGMLIAAGGKQAARYRWDGSLDAGGITNVIFDPTQISSEATGLAVQANGQLLAAGKVFTTDYDMGVARFTSDRHGLDVSFGTDTPRSGRTIYRFFHEAEEVRTAALAPDGKLIVAGQLDTQTQGSNANMMIGRFNTDGTADSGCALKGFNDVDFGVADDVATAIAVAGDKIYAAGTVRGPTSNDYGLVRFASNCSVDSTGGIQLRPYQLRLDLGGDESVAGVVIDAHGRPVLAGTSGNAIVLVRIRTNTLGFPQMDDAFGDHGRATLRVGMNAVAVGLAQQADGKLIAGGWVRIRKLPGFETRFLVARFTADGQLDPTFGDAGVTLAGTGSTAFALAVRSDDTIALSGATTSGTAKLFTVMQFTPSGQLDAAFNGTGIVTSRLGPDGEDIAQTLTFLGPNHLVVGGYSLVYGVRQFALVALDTTRAQAACIGDCNGDGSVTVDELLTMVNIVLGTTDVSACNAGDTNGDGEVTIDEILAAVNVALTSCPTA